MNRTALTAAASVLALSVAAGAISHAAAAGNPTHTMVFTAHQLGSKQTSPTSFVNAEKDVNAGKVVGFDVLSGSYNPSTKSTVVKIAISRRGGILYAELHGTDSLAGRVTGGSGAYAGVKGTITAAQGSGDSVRVTLTYRT